jgi:hypothetical protein
MGAFPGVRRNGAARDLGLQPVCDRHDSSLDAGRLDRPCFPGGAADYGSVDRNINAGGKHAGEHAREHYAEH